MRYINPRFTYFTYLLTGDLGTEVPQRGPWAGPGGVMGSGVPPSKKTSDLRESHDPARPGQDGLLHSPLIIKPTIN